MSKNIRLLFGLLGVIVLLFIVQKLNFPLGVKALVGSWSLSGNSMYYNDGNVAVGTNTPVTLFQVVGNSGIGSIIDPVKMSEIYDGDGEFNKLYYASDMEISGNYAFVTSYAEDSLTIIDISNPSDPVNMSEIYDGDGEFSKLDYTLSVAVSGSYAYVASSNDSSLTIIDISNPSDPVNMSEIYDGDGEFSKLAGARDVVISGNYAYVVSEFEDSLTIIDVSNPSNPVLKSETQYGDSGPTRVFVSGNYAYLTFIQAGAMRIIDISDPTNQVEKSVIRDEVGGFSKLSAIKDVYVQGNYAYMVSGDDNGFIIADVSNPLSPSKSSEITDGGASVFVSGNYAYVGGGGGNDVKFLNIENPSNPSRVSRVYDGDGEFSRLYGTSVVRKYGNYTYALGSKEHAFTIMKTDSVSDRNALFITNVGDVGISSSSPSATLDISGFMRLKKYSSAPVSCDLTHDGAIVLTSAYKGCVCKNSTGWVLLSDGTTGCAW